MTWLFINNKVSKINIANQGGYLIIQIFFGTPKKYISANLGNRFAIID